MPDFGSLLDQILALEEGDDASRRLAIRNLKAVDKKDWLDGPNDIIKALIDCLKNQLANGVKQPFIGQEASAILGHIGPKAKAAIPFLIDLMREGVPDTVREAAAGGLGNIGKESKPAVDVLVAALTNGRPPLAIHAVRALANIGCADQRVKNALSQLWLSPILSPAGQVQVGIALCKLKIDARGLLRILANTLVSNQDAALRKAAAEALAWCTKTDTDVVPALLTSALDDKNDDVRLVAEAGLEQHKLTREKAVLICAKQLKDSVYAETALRKSGPLAVPALIEALSESEPLTREKAARTLGGLGEGAIAAAPALTKALKDKAQDVRLSAAKGLWHITKEADAVVPVLIDLLDDKWVAHLEPGEARRKFVQTVIEALWRIGPPAKAAIPALARKAKDSNRMISESAVSAQRVINPSVPVKSAAR